MTTSVRVRFAPSPTGIPHVGNIRSALFNWLFARHHGGAFILRIEDTDQARLVPEALSAILDSLSWLGIDWDEGPTDEKGSSRGDFGPYIQSQRKEQGLYQAFARQLIDEGHAYECYCTPERLTEMRKRQQEQKQPPKYDERCRNLSDEERARQRGSGAATVVRFAIPPEGKTRFSDLVRGEIVFENETLDDMVLLKSDGFPTYHLANIVDDHHMEISHVIRAEEWVSSTPRHVLLYEALGWDPPLFAHLPMILGPDRSKLSKRHGATSLLEYRDEGFLPEAMMNFLALLGWALDDKTEIFNQGELIHHFTIERIGKTGAIFNREKLEWMNGLYIRNLPVHDLADRMLPFLEKSADIPKPVQQDYLARIVPLVQERVKTLAESAGLTDFFFAESINQDPDALVQKGMDREGALGALERALGKIEGNAGFDAEVLEGALRPLAEELGLKTGQLFGTLRVAVTGRSAAPPLFETMAVLGRDRCLSRIAAAIKALEG